jgi:hypothetical protein
MPVSRQQALWLGKKPGPFFTVTTVDELVLECPHLCGWSRARGPLMGRDFFSLPDRFTRLEWAMVVAVLTPFVMQGE